MAQGSDSRARKTSPIVQPFLGIHTDRPSFTADPRAFSDCLNVRIGLGRVDATQPGWSKLVNPASATLPTGSPIRGFYVMDKLDGSTIGIVATANDIMLVSATLCSYITPSYTIGSISGVAAGSVNGSGTLWNTSLGGNFRKAARIGDQIAFSANETSTTASWFTISAVNSDTNLVAAGAPNGYTGPYTIRERLTDADPALGGSARPYPFSFETFAAAGAPDNADLCIITNGNPSDCIIKYNPANLFATYQATMPFQAGVVRRFKNTMCYGNLFNPTTGAYSPTSMANSDNSLPFSMGTGVAGQYVISDGSYAIQSMEVLGNLLMCYTGGVLSGGVIGATFVGSPFNFVFTEIIRGQGPFAPRLVATFPDRHQFLSKNGEWRYNGLSAQAINTHFWRSFMPNIDLASTRRYGAHCTVIYNLGDIIWAVPIIGDGGTPIKYAYVEHTGEQVNNIAFKPFTKRDWPFGASTSAASGSGTNTLPAVAGDQNGGIWAMYQTGNQGQNFDHSGGSAATCSATFARRFVINERSRGLVKRIYPFIETTTGNLTVTLNLFDYVGQTSAARTDAQTFDMAYAGNRFTTHYRRGRVAELVFSGAGGWTLDGYDWDVDLGGER